MTHGLLVACCIDAMNRAAPIPAIAGLPVQTECTHTTGQYVMHARGHLCLWYHGSIAFASCIMLPFLSV